jgi:hypothetical protein
VDSFNRAGLAAALRKSRRKFRRWTRLPHSCAMPLQSCREVVGTSSVGNAEFGPAGEYLTVLEAAAETALWLYDKYPSIKACLDGPKSLEELQGDVGKPRKGYDVHHIVEQTAADRDGHSPEDIDGPDNLARIPRLKHWEITGWYMTPNERYNYLSPREYLRGKSWEERRNVGLDALMDFGVLKR